MNKICIFLTGCVNPNGMSFTALQDPNERKIQYIDAINFYLNNIPEAKIVFTENTNCQEFLNIFSDYIKSGRLEILCFDGNKYDKKLGKGYGEFEIIDYAISNSNIINESDLIIKITGRLKIININEIYNSILNIDADKLLCICNFHNYRKCPVFTHIFITNKETFKLFLNDKQNVNDSNGIYFEQIIYNNLINNDIYLYPLKPIPIIDGIAGTSKKPYSLSCSCINTDYDNMIIKKILNGREKDNI